MSSRKDQTRRAILDAAWRLLDERPPDSVRLQDIAAAANVSRQAVYLHFGSRGGVLVALIGYTDEVLGLAALLDEVAAQPTALARLERTLQVTARYASRIHELAIAFSRAQDDDDVREAFQDRMDLRRAGLREVITELAEEGRLDGAWTIEHAVDLLWSLGTPESYELLVVQRGWSVDDFERWLVHAARSLLREP